MSASNSGDRRTFLKTTAAVGVAASVNYAGAFAAGSDKIKVGLVGCGGRGNGAIKDILDAEAKINGKDPQLEIVAFGDAFQDKATGSLNRWKKDGRYGKQVTANPDNAYGG